MEEILSRVYDSRHAAAVALFNRDRLILGLRHYQADKWKPITVWTCPGGRCEEGETVEQVLRRETEEETGITEFVIEKFIGILPGAKQGDTLLLFLGRTSQEPKLMEPEKFSEWITVDLQEVPSNFINPMALELIRAHVA